jgi:hypothetical protein
MARLPRPPACRLSVIAASGFSGLAGLLPAGHGETTLAVGLVLAGLITTIILEWLWLRCWERLQGQPSRDLDQLLDRLEQGQLQSVDEVTRLAAILHASHDTLLHGRCSDTPPSTGTDQRSPR